MKIKLESSMCGHGFDHEAGAVIDWPDHEAQRMVADGLAIEVTETTTRQRPETAARKTPRRR